MHCLDFFNGMLMSLYPNIHLMYRFKDSEERLVIPKKIRMKTFVRNKRQVPAAPAAPGVPVAPVNPPVITATQAPAPVSGIPPVINNSVNPQPNVVTSVPLVTTAPLQPNGIYTYTYEQNFR